MIRTCLTLAAAATLIPVAAHAQAPCSLLTPDQIKAVLNSSVEPGQPGVARDSNDCTWSDANGEDRVYIALRPAADFRTFRAQIEKNGGHPTPVTGLGDDAFFVSPDDSSSALYVLAKNHLLLLTVTLPDGAQQTNQAAEKALATQIIPKL
ncbi:MAG TPA: hypothetical protein VHY48_06410 [Acidobacteriaceae bacterium]|jgi:hypothetical protein|nr:hypothetical protein [Acidobacteriaceae bacterium]